MCVFKLVVYSIDRESNGRLLILYALFFLYCRPMHTSGLTTIVLDNAGLPILQNQLL